MSENLKVSQGVDISTSTNIFVPTGVIIFIGGDTYDITSPLTTGLCPCDGRELSRADYASLFSVIGTTYGVGNGSTTFNVPNLNSSSRFIAMKNAQSLGSSAGNSSHTHTVNTNATGNTNTDSFDHSHSGYAGSGGGGSHATAMGGAYIGTNSAAAHVGAGAKRDGNNSLASINHSHAMYFNTTNTSNYGGDHSHAFYFNHGTASGTGHAHTYTTSGTTSSATSLPEYITALGYIKI
jgi:microcystin-dependent protein